MIEKMQKVTIFVWEKETEKFVEQLRGHGVLHIKNLRQPSSHEITFVRDRLGRTEKLITAVSPYYEGQPDRRVSGSERDVLSCEEDTGEDLKTLRDLEKTLEALEKRAVFFEVWGKFDPAELKALRAAGINVRLYEIPKKKIRAIDSNKVSVVNAKKDPASCVFISKDPEEKLDFREVALPEESPDEIEKNIDKARKEMGDIQGRMRTRARGLEAIKKCKRKLQKELKSLEVRFGMAGEDKVACIRGFCPVREAGTIRDMARAHGLGYSLEEPDEPEETPTLVTNPKWIDIITPVFRFMNTLPGYDEFDISFLFLAFFSVFFSMLIGDAGYGVLFLAATFLARRKYPRLPGQPFYLMYVLSVCTIIWGTVTGTWFGSEGAQKLPIISGMIIPSLNSFSSHSQNFLIRICFFIGAAHLSLAHILRIGRRSNSIRALAEAGWIMIVWGMYHAAGKFVLGAPFPEYAGWMLASGGTLALVFSNPEKGIIKGMADTAVNLPLSVIGSFSDVISYIRLFAVGMATVVVAQSFNGMAFGGETNSIVSGAVSSFILFAGHALNIILAFMAVIVHGIRLNMLEFSGHLGMQWTGKKYDPFRD